MNYRKATFEDIPSLIALRKQQLIDEGIDPVVQIDEELKNYFKQCFINETIIEWLVEDKGTIVATGAIVFYAFPPSYTNASGIRGYITNMYTHPTYRKQGIATSLLERLIQEAKDRNVIKVWLGASTLGRPVYEKFGFKQSDEWLEL